MELHNGCLHRGPNIRSYGPAWEVSSSVFPKDTAKWRE